MGKQYMTKPVDFTEDINMEQKLLQALSAHYSAILTRAEANLINYFKNPNGIGEHPDIVEEMVKQIDKISAAKGALDTLQNMVQQPDEPDIEADEESNEDVPIGDQSN